MPKEKCGINMKINELDRELFTICNTIQLDNYKPQRIWRFWVTLLDFMRYENERD